MNRFLVAVVILYVTLAGARPALASGLIGGGGAGSQGPPGSTTNAIPNPNGVGTNINFDPQTYANLAANGVLTTNSTSAPKLFVGGLTNYPTALAVEGSTATASQICRYVGMGQVVLTQVWQNAGGGAAGETNTQYQLLATYAYQNGNGNSPSGPNAQQGLLLSIGGCGGCNGGFVTLGNGATLSLQSGVGDGCALGQSVAMLGDSAGGGFNINGTNGNSAVIWGGNVTIAGSQLISDIDFLGNSCTLYSSCVGAAENSAVGQGVFIGNSVNDPVGPLTGLPSIDSILIAAVNATVSNSQYCTMIGDNSGAFNSYGSTAIGAWSTVATKRSGAGYSAVLNATNAFQLGPGTNTANGTLQFYKNKIASTNGDLFADNLTVTNSATITVNATVNGTITAGPAGEFVGNGGGLTDIPPSAISGGTGISLTNINQLASNLTAAATFYCTGTSAFSNFVTMTASLFVTNGAEIKAYGAADAQLPSTFFGSSSGVNISAGNENQVANINLNNAGSISSSGTATIQLGTGSAITVGGSNVALQTSLNLILKLTNVATQVGTLYISNGIIVNATSP